MHYIKHNVEPYFNNNDFREISKISGEVLGSYETKTDKKGAKTKINIKLDENVLELTEDMIVDNFTTKSEMYLNISEKKIYKKTKEMLLHDAKTQLKNQVLLIAKDDPNYQFEVPEARAKYQKIFDDIEKANTIEELQKITTE